jgi:YbbR domain-containing protein
MLPRAMLEWRRIATPLALALVSLLAAVAMWIAVTEAENPNEVRVFGGSIEVQAVNVPDGRAVASIRDPVVSLTVSAPADVLEELSAADFRAEVDLAGVLENSSEQRVVARVSGNRDVQIVNVSPSVVTVALETLTSKTVPVRPNTVGSPPQGYRVDVNQIEASPGQVRVSGAESRVNSVSYVAADVNLTGIRVSLRQRYQLVPKDSRGAEVSRVVVEPATAELRVNVEQQDITLTVSVVPSAQGVVADGYNLSGIQADPPAIAVSGPLELLLGLPYISTEPVDVTGLRTDAVRTARLRLPAGIQSPRDSVTVRLRVEPSKGEFSLVVPLQVTNVPEGLQPFLQSPNLTLRFAGEIPTLQTLGSSNVRASVNLSGLNEGVHVLRPTISAPESVQLVSVEPPQVTVSLQR